MAQRQLARRLVGLGSAICRARCTVRAVTAVRALPTQHQPLYRAAAALHTTTARHNANIINIQDEDDFKKRVIDSTTPVIVDFHAGWCGPCKMLGPRLESMVSERDGKVVLAKVDIDENSDLAMEHGVEAVPTVLAMKDGNIVDKFIGMKDDASLESFIDGLVR